MIREQQFGVNRAAAAFAKAGGGKPLGVETTGLRTRPGISMPRWLGQENRLDGEPERQQ